MVYKTWKALLNSKSDLPIEHQIFYFFSIFLFSALLVSFFTNIILEQYVSAIIVLSAAIIQTITYLIIRKSKNYNFAILIFLIYTNIFLVLNYFYNSGISGPTIFILITSLFVSLSICKRKQMFYMFLLNFVIVCALSFIEYNFPHSIKNYYSTTSQLFADNMSTYTICIIFMYLGSVYIKDSYLKEKHERLLKSKSLEILNKSKDKILSIISHDLRSPMASIQQYLELVGKEDLDLESRKFIEKNLLKTTINTQELLNNLLLWSKNQLQGNDALVRPINLKEELKSTIESMSLLAFHKNITLTSTYYNDSIVMGDVTMLQMVVRNLLHNAIKFTESFGKVEFISKEVDDKNIITILDNGIGMTDYIKSKVFNLNIESTYGTDNENGAGLGLVMCKEYTERQGGELWFESKLGEGTIFYLSLPIH